MKLIIAAALLVLSGCTTWTHPFKDSAAFEMGFIQLTCTLIYKAFPIDHNTLDLHAKREYSAVMASSHTPPGGE